MSPPLETVTNVLDMGRGTIRVERMLVYGDATHGYMVVGEAVWIQRRGGPGRLILRQSGDKVDLTEPPLPETWTCQDCGEIMPTALKGVHEAACEPGDAD